MEARLWVRPRSSRTPRRRPKRPSIRGKLDAQKPQIAWREPSALKLGEDVAEPEVVATEPATQLQRQKRLMEAQRYFHARDIPDNPADDGMETFRIDSSTVEIPAQELEKQPEEVPVEEPPPPPVPAPPPQDVWTAPTPQFTPSFGQPPPHKITTLQHRPSGERGAARPTGGHHAARRGRVAVLAQNQALYVAFCRGPTGRGVRHREFPAGAAAVTTRL